MFKKLLTLLLLCATTALHAANYLTFTAEADSSAFGIHNERGNNPQIEYSLDGGTSWESLKADTLICLVREGDKALLRGMNPKGFSREGCTEKASYTHFVMTGRIAASGSIMSLLDGRDGTTVIPNTYCFYRLFQSCESLTQAPELPATYLSENCYVSMFSGCTSLTQAPELPATQLAAECYIGMFSKCTNLTQAPQLPATQLTERCYEHMFSGCSSLTLAPQLPATQLAKSCYAGMFYGCTSLKQAPELPASQLAEDCYSYMFLCCKSLIKAPEILPAVELANRCYASMFMSCTSLKKAPRLPATKMASQCYFSMFLGCTSLKQAPELPATKMAEGCYDHMFQDCHSLAEIKVKFKTWSHDYYGNIDWLRDTSPTGTFICPAELSKGRKSSKIPEGWKVIEN